jgi:uncharacterized protein YpmS
MRKIESQMIQAIKSETDWKSGNTKVVNFFNDGDKCVVASVFLHGNKIAEVSDNDMTIFDGGWQSNTTKSRLNALINEFCNAFTDGVFQKNYQWFVRDNNVTKEFTNGYIFS